MVPRYMSLGLWACCNNVRLSSRELPKHSRSEQSREYGSRIGKTTLYFEAHGSFKQTLAGCAGAICSAHAAGCSGTGSSSSSSCFSSTVGVAAVLPPTAEEALTGNMQWKGDHTYQHLLRGCLSTLARLWASPFRPSCFGIYDRG